MIVSNGGWTYKQETVDDKVGKYYTTPGTKKFAVRMSMNGPAFLSMSDLDEITKAVSTAQKELAEL